MRKSSLEQYLPFFIFYSWDLNNRGNYINSTRRPENIKVTNFVVSNDADRS